MKTDSGATVSLWMETEFPPGIRQLTAPLQTEVCIIGAGIAGLTTAYLLARDGKKVVVLDDGPIAGGETSRTTAHLSNAFDDRYFEVERIHGEHSARLTAQSHTAAIGLIESIAGQEKIPCDFLRVDGYLFLAPGSEPGLLDRELASAHRVGLKDVSRLLRAPLQSFDTGPCLHFPNQGQFHPLNYLQGLAQAIQARGGQIFSGVHVRHLQSGHPARLETSDGVAITADAVVVATNTPINDRFAIHTKQAPYRTYAIAARIPRGSVPAALYWDTAEPYHYVRLQGSAPSNSSSTNPNQTEFDLLIIGGEDHKTGQPHSDQGLPWARLETWARERFPIIQSVDFQWSGQVMEPSDYLAFIGKNPGDEENIFIATGDSGQGMTHGTIAGMLLTDLIMGRPNPWTELYDPSRIRRSATKDFAVENLNVAAQYTDWVTGGEVGAVEEIAPGMGAIIRRGLKKLAVYRDEAGHLHERSAICPHLGCVVTWNVLERTWDCPCHGSRYQPQGKVVNGPANSDLPSP